MAVLGEKLYEGLLILVALVVEVSSKLRRWLNNEPPLDPWGRED